MTAKKDECIRGYRPGDIFCIRVRPDFAELARDLPFDGGEPDIATSHTIERDGRILACGGFIRERLGVYSLWGLCGEDLTRRDWVEVAYMAKAILSLLFANGAHRVHSMARADSEKAVKYLMHLGLQNDMNRLVAFGPEGEDYVLMAAIKGLRG